MNRTKPGLHRPRPATGASVARVTAIGLAVLLPAMSAGPVSAALRPGSVANSTLKMAFEGDIGAPDPDVFYATEGLEVTTSVYQGLLQYANNSTRIVGNLAKSWSVSPDRLTYTFRLESHVKFHDGTPFNAAAVKFSFERRTAIGQGPAYMLAHVKAVDTPGPAEVVVHLDSPASAFLDYLASPFGPKMMSPTTINAHVVKGDWAQHWLLNHDAGTGPYSITSWVSNQHYVLSRFNGYWGPKPGFAQVMISIVPDISVQQIQLRSGQLDMITHGLVPKAASDFAASTKFEVREYPTEMKGILFVNSHRGPFTTTAGRDALERVLNKASMSQAVYGSAGRPSTQLYPAGEIPLTDQSSVVKYDPSVLKALVPSLASKSVNIGFDPTDPRNQLLAELAQVALQGAGMTASTRPIPIAQIFGLAANPSKAPDILIQTTNPDAAHPDTWSRIYMSKSGGANYLQCSSPAADALMNKGLAATTTAAVDVAYGEAGTTLVKQGCFIDIADVQDVIVARKGITGFYHVPSIPWALNLTTLRNG